MAKLYCPKTGKIRCFACDKKESESKCVIKTVYTLKNAAAARGKGEKQCRNKRCALHGSTIKTEHQMRHVWAHLRPVQNPRFMVWLQQKSDFLLQFFRRKSQETNRNYKSTHRLKTGAIRKPEPTTRRR